MFALSNPYLSIFDQFSFITQTTTQIQTLRKVLASLPSTSPSIEDHDENSTAASRFPLTPTPAEPSETAALTSLFGWSIAPSASEQASPSSLPRTASVSSSRPGTPTPGPPRPLLRSGTVSAKRDTSLLHCALCQRRVGLWAFGPSARSPLPSLARRNTISSTENVTESGASLPPPRPPQRQFDLLREHRSYCPYVVRSTFIPSLPVFANGPSRSTVSLNGQNDGALEGWRAVLAVVLRYGMSRRHRTGLRNPTDMQEGGQLDDADPPGDLDGVEAMVAGVKTRGVSSFVRLHPPFK
jgi:hypothetical protein